MPVGSLILAVSSTSFGLQFYVAQYNGTSHAGAGIDTGSQATAGSPQVGVYVSGSQIATYGGAGGVGSVAQSQSVRGNRLSTPIYQLQRTIDAGMTQSMDHTGGIGATSASQVGYTLMTQDDTFGCHGRSVQHTLGWPYRRAFSSATLVRPAKWPKPCPRKLGRRSTICSTPNVRKRLPCRVGTEVTELP